MKTLYDFGIAVQKIREAANSLEIKGQENAAAVVYICNQCNEIISAINQAIAEAQAGDHPKTEGPEGGGEDEPDSGIS